MSGVTVMSDTPALPPLAVTMGEPAGIGGEIALRAWTRRAEAGRTPFFLIDNPDRLSLLAQTIGLAVPVTSIECPEDVGASFDRALPVLPLRLAAPVKPGTPDPANAGAVAEAIDRAAALCVDGRAGAVVTNPINKDAMYRGGFQHPGHTEYLAHIAGVPRTVMMLVGDGLRTVPVTVHVSLADAVRTLDRTAIVETCRIVDAALRRDFAIAAPRLAVSGLNPHAGEAGALGREEIDIVEPAVAELRAEGLDVLGPLPADTMFHADARAKYDAAVCMTHDQALIPVKTLDFHGGVNATLGLPFVRTSPDHGTAFALAGKGTARPDSLLAALRLAERMAAGRRRPA